MTDAAPPTGLKFYTTGFAGKEINDLKPMLERLDAILIDVRFSPSESERLRWRQIYLKALLREKYRHVTHLGIRSTRAGGGDIHHLDLGIKILLSFGSNAVLMCECAEIADCHRRLIAEELRRRGFETAELSDWKNADS